MDSQNHPEEYRQLTFLFCDLVDSTPLSQALEDEDWRMVLSQFQASCMSQVQYHGGAVYEFQGDGFLFHFGYPRAQEDSASNAIQAALAIIDDCRYGLKQANALLLQSGQSGLRVRAGVHSGYVVIGKRHGRDLATGFPLAFTQRIHTCAAPNSVVVSDEIRRLVAGRFTLVDLGEKQLKGIEKPVACYRVKTPISEFTASRDASPLVGRFREMNRLKELWQQTTIDHGSAHLLIGDAGIGKSRLLREFLNVTNNDHVTQLIWNCSLEHSNSALHPVIEGVCSAIDFTNLSKTPEHSDHGVGSNAELSPQGLSRPDDIVEAMEQVVPSGGRATGSTPASISDSQKHRIVGALVDWLVRESLYKPICLIVEDIHWIDPSSAEFLECLQARLSESQLLLLLTCRSESWENFSPRFNHIKRVFESLQASAMLIEKLSRQSSHELIRAVDDGKTLSHEIVNQLVQRSDGIPLFLEESAAMFVDDAALDQPVARRKLNLQVQAQQIPSRLMDLLSVRLDSMGDARHTAGLASSIGREFTPELLADISELDRHTIEQHLEQLLATGLLRKHERDQQKLVFKHALVRDAAYLALLKSTRRAYHSRIGRTLESRATADPDATAQVLAYHFSAAEEPETAIDYWLIAARSARLNSNPAEACNHYQQAQDLLSMAQLSAQYPRKDKELQLQLGLGACHIALVGYASDDARRCYESAEALADELGTLEKRLKVHFGLEAHYFMRGNFKKALEFAEYCHSEAQTLLTSYAAGDDNAGAMRSRLTLAQANWAIGNILFHQGEFKRSTSLLNQCIELCKQPSGSQFKLAHDPSIMSQLYRAWFRCEAGNLDQALKEVQQTLQQARSSGHVYTIGVALAFNACIHFFRNEFDDVIALASKSISHSEKPGFTTWFTWAKVLRGRALCESSTTRDQGLNEIIDGLELWENSGAIVTRPFTLALLAESLLLCGRTEQANAHISAARDLVDQFGERYYECEIYRISGRVVQQPPYENSEQACLFYRHALKTAGEQGLRRSMLRAAIDLTTLQINQGWIPETLNTLVQCRQAITCGEQTSDVIAADLLIASQEDPKNNNLMDGLIIA